MYLIKSYCLNNAARGNNMGTLKLKNKKKTLFFGVCDSLQRKKFLEYGVKKTSTGFEFIHLILLFLVLLFFKSENGYLSFAEYLFREKTRMWG